jgi:hypothetical protein
MPAKKVSFARKPKKAGKKTRDATAFDFGANAAKGRKRGGGGGGS